MQDKETTFPAPPVLTVGEHARLCEELDNAIVISRLARLLCCEPGAASVERAVRDLVGASAGAAVRA